MATDVQTPYVRWHDINQVNNISEFLIQTHFLVFFENEFQ